MPILFTCPHCGAETDVAEEFAGRSGPCARCGRTITIPSSAAAPGGYAAAKSPSHAPVVAAVLVALLAVVLVCGGFLIVPWLFMARTVLPAVEDAREAARRAQCTNHLRQISMAVYQYQERYECFPPAYVADENGRPMHSWRVLILPFLGHQALYDRYDLSEPWNSPNNRVVTSTPLEVYTCPSYDGSDPLETNYVMILGPGTFSSGAESTRNRDLRDGPVNTIMLVETTDSGIHWAEPRDLRAEQITFGINDDQGGGLRSRHPGGANVALGDGSVRFLSEWTSAEDVRAMTTINGGEVVTPIN